MQARFRHAFASAEPTHDPSKLITLAPHQATGNRQANSPTPSAESSSFLTNSKSAELHRDLLDARDRQDRVAILSLVAAYRNLPSSQKTTAGFNAALQAQLSVRQPGESLREVRETHKDMIDAGCLPNSSTSAVLVKALCARDQEKQMDDTIPEVSLEEQASAEAWRILTATPSGLHDIGAYNALLSRCAANGDSDRAFAVFRMIEDTPQIQPDAMTYVSLLTCFTKLPRTNVKDEQVGSRLPAINQTLEEAITAMRSPNWVNDAARDQSIFRVYIEAVMALRASDAAVALFQRMIMNEDDLPSPSAEVTGALIHGFADCGDAETARAWIDKIEAINRNSSEPVLDAPDFNGLKVQLAPKEETEAEEPVAEETVAEATPVETKQDASSPADSGFEALSPSTMSPAVPAFVPVSAAPSFLHAPVLQLVDCDLGERIKAMLRPRRNAPGGSKDKKPPLEVAYRILMSEISQGNYAPPEVFAQLLNSFGREGKLHRVEELRAHAHAAIAGLVGDPAWQQSAWVEVEDNVVSAFAHGGDLEAAHAVRHAMLDAGFAPSANSYAALISSIRDSTDEALLAEQLFDESQRLGVRPNIYLVNTVISRLGRARRAEKALQLYHSLPNLGLKPTSITYGATLNCAVRVGDIATAETIFSAMESDPSFVARPPGYNSMIQFFTYTQPDRQKAMLYWDKMQKRGVRPSSHTYKLLLDLHATIEPVQPDAMNSLFAQLLRDRNVEVAGPHWASLITCYGCYIKDLDKCIEIFRSIPLKTGNAPDAVAYEALLQVYSQHGRVDLIDSLLAEMLKCGVGRTAYIANHAIDGYARHGGSQGLLKARTIFMAMSQPPAGIASAGNHPLPRHHGAGSGSGSLYTDRRSESNQMRNLSIEDVLASTSSHATAPLDLSVPQQMELLTLAFETVHPEPSTYEKMIQFEVSKGHYMNGKMIVAKMEERAFPPALVLRARGLLAGEMAFGGHAE